MTVFFFLIAFTSQERLLTGERIKNASYQHSIVFPQRFQHFQMQISIFRSFSIRVVFNLSFEKAYISDLYFVGRQSQVSRHYNNLEAVTIEALKTLV